MTKTDLARVLGVSVRHTGSLASQGLVVLDKRGAVDIPRTIAALFAAAQARSAARSARDRLVEAQVMGARMRAERIARRFLTLDEVGALANVLIENGYVISRRESSLLYSELCGEAPEAMARQVAGRFERRVMGVFNGFRNGMRELTETILQDRLHNADRLDEILKKFIPKQTGDEDADDDEETQTNDEGESQDHGGDEEATTTPTGKKRSTRPKRPRAHRRDDARRSASAAAVKGRTR